MWLINTTKFELEFFTIRDLVHTWSDEEVSFQEFQDLEKGKTKTKSGFSKVEMTYQFARDSGIEYA
jgi:hypothetical protein